MQVQRELSNRNSGELRCKLVLFAVLLIGAALIWAGVWGMGELTDSGFDQEGAYGVIYQLSPAMDEVYGKDVLPYLNQLDATDREAFNAKVRELLVYIWSTDAKEDRSELVNSILAGEKDPEAAAVKLLAVSYSMSGPKVSSKEKKEMETYTDAQRNEFRTQLLTGILDGFHLPLPPLVKP